MGKHVAVERSDLEVSVQTTDTTRVHLQVRAGREWSFAVLSASEARALAAVLLERADWSDFVELRTDDDPARRCLGCGQALHATTEDSSKAGR